MKRLLVFVLALTCLVQPVAVVAQGGYIKPEPLGMTIAEYIEQYNTSIRGLDELDSTEMYVLESGSTKNWIQPASADGTLSLQLQGEDILILVGVVYKDNSIDNMEKFSQF